METKTRLEAERKFTGADEFQAPGLSSAVIPQR
jgi:hypothetical protein